MSFPYAAILPRTRPRVSPLIATKTSSLIRIDNRCHRKIEGNYDSTEYERQLKGE
jgi:hypothetical protein